MDCNTRRKCRRFLLGMIFLSVCFQLQALCRSGDDTLYPVSKHGKWGYINQRGKLVVDFVFDHAGLFYRNRAVVKEGTSYGVVNEKGRYVIEPSFGFISGFDCIPALASRNGEKFMLFPDGRTISYRSMGIDHVLRCHEGLLFFQDAEKRWGLLDSTGRVVVPAQYEDVHVFREQRASVKQNGMWGYIDTEGRRIVPCVYSSVKEYFFNGLSAVKNDSGWFVIDSAGHRISAYFFTSITHRYRTFTGGTFNGKMRFIDRSGKLLFPDAFDSSATVFVNHLESHIPVMQDSLWGYVNHHGEWIITPRFESVTGFYEYWAEVRVNGRAGIIGTDGRYIVTPQYESCAWLYPSGIVKVRNDDQLTHTLVDTTGKLILPAECHRFYYFEKEHIIWTVINEKWIAYDERGNQRSQPLYYWSEPVYSFLTFYLQPFDTRDSGADTGYMNVDGRIIWNPAK